LENADFKLIGIGDSHTGYYLIEPTTFLEKPPRLIPRLSSEVGIAIQVNTLGNGAALHLSIDRLVLYPFVSTEAMGRFSENEFHLRPYQNERKTIVFDPLTSNDVVGTELFENTLRIEHLGTLVVRSLSDMEHTGITDHLR
jgi:hypothetical protein